MGYTINQYHGNYNIQTRTTSVKYIVVHYVGAGSSASGNALANCKYFAGGNRQASAHYFIDDANIYEYANPSTYATWHCGDGKGKYGITNQNSIGIEVCNNGGPFTDAEISRLTWLVQKLMSDFGVSASHVVRHYDASRKLCPLYYAQNSSAWNSLHAQITGGSTSSSSSSGFGGTYKSTIDDLNVRQSASTSGRIVGQMNTGNTVVLEEDYSSADGYIWGHTTGYVAVGRATGKAEDDDFLVKVTNESKFGGTYAASKEWMNIRQSPSLSGHVFATMPQGSTVVLSNTYKRADGYIWGIFTAYVAVGRATGKVENDDYLVK